MKVKKHCSGLKLTVLTHCTYIFRSAYVSVSVSHVSCFVILISGMINANNWHLTNTAVLSFSVLEPDHTTGLILGRARTKYG